MMVKVLLCSSAAPNFVPEPNVSSEEEGVAPDAPQVGLEELLQDLTIGDGPSGTQTTLEQMSH